MSYALRNTLILLTTLVLLVTAGWLYLTYQMDIVIHDQRSELNRKRTTLNTLTTKANDYVVIQERHAAKQFESQNHNKELYPNSNVAIVFDFLRQINSGNANTVMNFALRDSVINPDHGIIRVRLDGEGAYSNLFNFILIMEQSKPVTRITNIRIAPRNLIDNLNIVQFEMDVSFYYARGGTQTDGQLIINRLTPSNIQNPLYPLVHQAPPNTNNLPDTDRIRLVGLAGNGAYIINQNGEFMFLPIGGRVYLGSLQRVDLNQKSATFRLNRGGLPDTVVLTINE